MKKALAHFLKALETPRCFDDLLPPLAGLGFSFSSVTVSAGRLELEIARHE